MVRRRDMKWNVFIHDVNTCSIKEYDIFRHRSFAQDVAKLFKQDLTIKDFAERLKREVQYYFWGRCEMEQVICSWPVYIDGEELARINKEYEEHNEKWGRYPYKVNIKPDVGRKIDIYQQVMLNFDVFCEYVWSQRMKQNERCK
jgi:hypothetical protein